MTPSLVSQSWNAFGGALKGLMTWSVNWDGSKGWTFGDNARFCRAVEAAAGPVTR